MANAIRKRKIALTGDSAKDAERFSSLRAMAMMSEKEREAIFEKLGEPLIIVAESFDKWADDLTQLLFKEKRKKKPTNVPDEA